MNTRQTDPAPPRRLATLALPARIGLVPLLWTAAATVVVALALLWALRPTLTHEIRPDQISLYGGQAYASGPLFGKRHAYVVPGDGLKQPERSRLVLLEDGAPLGPAHSLHKDIGEDGHGRYSHWGDVALFSSSDGTDPRTNGRRYVVRVRAELRPWVAFLGLALPAALAFGALGLQFGARLRNEFAPFLIRTLKPYALPTTLIGLGSAASLLSRLPPHLLSRLVLAAGLTVGLIGVVLLSLHSERVLRTILSLRAALLLCRRGVRHGPHLVRKTWRAVEASTGLQCAIAAAAISFWTCHSMIFFSDGRPSFSLVVNRLVHTAGARIAELGAAAPAAGSADAEEQASYDAMFDAIRYVRERTAPGEWIYSNIVSDNQFWYLSQGRYSLMEGSAMYQVYSLQRRAAARIDSFISFAETADEKLISDYNLRYVLLAKEGSCKSKACYGFLGIPARIEAFTQNDRFSKAFENEKFVVFEVAGRTEH